MKTLVRKNGRREEGAIIAYFIILVIAAAAIASVGAYVSQTSLLSKRRSDMAAANQFAIAGAVIACDDLNRSLTNQSGMQSGLTTSPTPATRGASFPPANAIRNEDISPLGAVIESRNSKSQPLTYIPQHGKHPALRVEILSKKFPEQKPPALPGG